mmetsp:Transcript_10344/g.19962  ORF Transcript_10344/g.19962 Transcript_10344/m.19962 type:complete len:622 (-) Transcript_10344:184-2049(-)
MTPTPEPHEFLSEMGNVYVSIQVEENDPKSVLVEQSNELLHEKSPAELIHENYRLKGEPEALQQDYVDPLSFVCKWIPTNIRLAKSCKDPKTLYTDIEEECYLCLPVPSSSQAILSENIHENEDCKIEEQTDATATKYRLMALDHYIASAAPLLASTRKLLSGGKAGCVASNETDSDVWRCNGSIEINSVNNRSHCRRTKYDRDQTHPTQPNPSTSPHHLVTSTNSGRVLNVLQGEIAHCTPQQADIVVSDDATTCHIVALWSRLNWGGNKHSGKRDHDGVCVKNICSSAGLSTSSILATMAHIDGTGYDACLREAVKEHFFYHLKPDEPNSWTHRGNHGTIEMSIHLMGGFNDEDGSSIEITDDVLRTLSALADEFGHLSLNENDGTTRICMTLETCAVSSANDNGSGCPIGRGLAMEVSAGTVFLAEVEDDSNRAMSSSVLTKFPFKSAPSIAHALYPSSPVVSRDGLGFISVDGDVHIMDIGIDTAQNFTTCAEGPETILRGIRLWAAAFHPTCENQQRKLTLIHCPKEDCLRIQPFAFGPHSYARDLLRLNDFQLLHYTSTSPKVEKSNFTSKVRKALMYMNATVSSRVFEVTEGVVQPIKYERVGLNGWALCEGGR